MSTSRPRRLAAAPLVLGVGLAALVAPGGPTSAAPAPATGTTAAAAAVGAAPATAPRRARTGADRASRRLQRAVTPQAVRRHLLRLQAIAEANDGTRVVGTEGFRDSRDYIVTTLRDAGYRPQVQPFTVDVFRELSPASLSQVAPDATEYAEPDDFVTMTYSGSGDVTGDVVAVDTDLTPSDTSTSGCEAEDFAGFPAGAIALVQRGTCSFAQKVANAGDAGAAAVLVSNRGTTGEEGPVAGTLGGPGDYVPALGLSLATAQALVDTSARVVVDAVSESARTWNIIAETRGGNRGNVVMAGAHLDSVPEGPGINDNGSGSAALLTIAEELGGVSPANRNQVRFAWWAAEEQGLIGSDYYVNNLLEDNPAALADIRLYLNFDMVGSPNFARFVYDGDGSGGGPVGPAGSAAIEQVFQRHFRRAELGSAPTEFNGRSDYGPFIANGIPAGGLFSGAEGIKTEREAARFGGTAGEAYDACYHQACDTVGNVNMRAINQFSDAMADAVARFGRSTSALQADYRRQGSAPRVEVGGLRR